MAIDLVPSSFFRVPSLRPYSIFDEEDDFATPSPTGGLTIAEDEHSVFVQAALPGVDPKDIEVTVDKGIVWIKGETKEEETKKKFYRKATSMFSYRVGVPGDIDESKEPQASCKNGIMTITFTKSPKSQPKKITVKS